jgi:IS4 transposase
MFHLRMAPLLSDIGVANRPITDGRDAMPIQPTPLLTIMQQVPWGVLDRVSQECGADCLIRNFSLRSHLAAMLVAQLSGARSLREVESIMAANATALSAVGVERVSRSTLADANSRRPAELFEALLPPLLERLPRKQRREAKDVIRLLDSTPIYPGAGAADWAHFEKDLVGAKIHVAYDPAARVPVFFQVTSGNTNDITVAKAAVPIESGATYVFDLGYYDFKFWADLHQAGCTLVTRLKRNTSVTEIERRPPPPGTNILSDRTVNLPKRLAKSRKNPFSARGREIVVRIQTGKTIALFTNDLVSPAEKIADLYKTRWQIELFFRWIKQNLRIRKFLGTRKNAVRLQTAIAMLSYIILYLVHFKTGFTKNIQIFTAIIRQNLFHRTTIRQIIDRLATKEIPEIEKQQLKMVFT